MESIKKIEYLYSLWPQIDYFKKEFLSLFALCVFYKAKTKFYFKNHDLAKKIGLKYIIPIAEWDTTPKLNIPDASIVKNSQDSIKEFFNNSNSDRIKIKIASGYDCFGPEGFLRELIETNTHVSWQILIIDPQSESAKARYRSYKSLRSADRLQNVSEQKYLKGIEERIQYLKNVQQKINRNIEIKKYTHTPQWRIYLTSKAIIVSGFGPGQRSDRSPLFNIESNSTSLFHGYREMFEDIWHNASSDA